MLTIAQATPCGPPQCTETSVTLVILFVLFALAGLSFATGWIVDAFDRRGLQAGRADAYGRGIRLVSDRGPLNTNAASDTASLRTGHGDGRWITDRAFAFWAQGYHLRADSQNLAWTGLATSDGHQLTYEVRVMRGKALSMVATLTVPVLLTAVTLALGEYFIAPIFAVLAVGVFAWARNLLRHERNLARLIVRELREAFEHG